MKIIVADTETTGIPLPSSVPIEKQPRIIELGLVVRSFDEIIGEYNWLFNPGNLPLPQEITKITGLTDADLIDQLSFKEQLDEIIEIFSGADVFIAHNAPFDTSILKFALQMAECNNFPWPDIIICSAQEMMSHFGYRPKAAELYEHFVGKKIKQTHRALDDAKMLNEALECANFYEFLK